MSEVGLLTMPLIRTGYISLEVNLLRVKALASAITTLSRWLTIISNTPLATF